MAEKRVAAVNDGRNNGAVVVIGAGFDGRPSACSTGRNTAPGNAVIADVPAARDRRPARPYRARRTTRVREIEPGPGGSDAHYHILFISCRTVCRGHVPQRAPLPLPVIEWTGRPTEQAVRASRVVRTRRRETERTGEHVGSRGERDSLSGGQRACDRASDRHTVFAVSARPCLM